MHPAPSLVSAGANAEPFRAKDGVKKILEAMRIFSVPPVVLEAGQASGERRWVTHRSI
jgi:hypothetical protein